MSRTLLARLAAHLLPISLTVITCYAPPAAAADWSRFRGPNGSGLGQAEGLPVEFGPETNVVWQTEVPFGRSSPVVGKRLIFLTGIDDDEMVVVALDRATGRKLWRRGLARNHRAEFHHAADSSSSTPVTDGENVYAFFHEAGLVSYDGAGKERWRHPLGPFRNYYSVAASPILAGDRLLMLCDQAEDSFLLALDKNTGEELWRRARPDRPEAYATPILLDDGTVVVAGSRWIDAYDPATGETRWSLGGLGSSPIASPVVDGGTLYLATIQFASKAPPPFSELAGEHDEDGDGELSREEVADTWMGSNYPWVNVDGEGGISEADWQVHSAQVVNDSWGVQAVRLPTPGGKAELLWSYRKNVPYIPTPLVHEGVLYVVKDGIVSSLDPTNGKLLKRDRLGDGSPKISASPIAADGKLYIATQNGRVAVLAAGTQLEVLASNDLGEQIFATPAIADNRLLVRSESSLYAFAAPPAPRTQAGAGN